MSKSTRASTVFRRTKGKTVYYAFKAINGKYLSVSTTVPHRIFAAASVISDRELFSQQVVAPMPDGDAMLALKSKYNSKFVQVAPDYKNGHNYMKADVATWAPSSTHLLIHVAGVITIDGTKYVEIQAKALNERWLSLEKVGARFPVLASVVARATYPSTAKTKFVLYRQ